MACLFLSVIHVSHESGHELRIYDDILLASLLPILAVVEDIAFLVHTEESHVNVVDLGWLSVLAS